ncbi:hypothetical protein [Lactococcus protaetiae]|uniref:Uncharacterized protein n=1 Tax=Lactococcus protaetiae TaxID=2592653 RepID=A0A514Z718_9LACT|nr:hypothetical protein [Lactococcus protaetiae]QDK70398.1 hypothetical protein FLP15_03445 [Lactococcus protaetiae]
MKKQASAEDASKVAPILKDKVVNPRDSGVALVANTIFDESELMRITNSKEFIATLRNKVFTNTKASLYNFNSSIKGFEIAKKEFDALKLADVKTYPSGTIVGKLPNGDIVNLHPGSSVGGAPSLEIQSSLDKTINIKIRY